MSLVTTAEKEYYLQASKLKNNLDSILKKAWEKLDSEQVLTEDEFLLIADNFNYHYTRGLIDNREFFKWFRRENAILDMVEADKARLDSWGTDLGSRMHRRLIMESKGLIIPRPPEPHPESKLDLSVRIALSESSLLPSEIHEMIAWSKGVRYFLKYFNPEFRYNLRTRHTPIVFNPINQPRKPNELEEIPYITLALPKHEESHIDSIAAGLRRYYGLAKTLSESMKKKGITISLFHPLTYEDSNLFVDPDSLMLFFEHGRLIWNLTAFTQAGNPWLPNDGNQDYVFTAKRGLFAVIAPDWKESLSSLIRDPSMIERRWYQRSPETMYLAKRPR